MAKTKQRAYDHGCPVGGTVTGPVAVSGWGDLVTECRRLVVRDNDGNRSSPA